MFVLLWSALYAVGCAAVCAGLTHCLHKCPSGVSLEPGLRCVNASVEECSTVTTGAHIPSVAWLDEIVRKAHHRCVPWENSRLGWKGMETCITMPLRSDGPGFPQTHSEPRRVFLDHYAVEEPVRKLVRVLFPGAQQIDFATARASNASSNDVLVIGRRLSSLTQQQRCFPGVVVVLEGESTTLFNREGRYVYLGPLSEPHPGHYQFYYAQLMAVVAGVRRLLLPRVSEHSKFLLYRQSHCVDYRDQAFDKICRRFSNRRCTRSKCGAGTPADVIPRQRDHWFLNDSPGQYRYELSMENANVPGYVTEKIVNAFLSGSVPIYYGTKEVFKLFNKDAFVYYDINNPGPSLDKIAYLEFNNTAYREMLAQPILAQGAMEKYFSFDANVSSGFVRSRIRDLIFSARSWPTTKSC